MDDRVRGRGRESADLTYRNAITATYRSQLDVRQEIELALAELRSCQRVKLSIDRPLAPNPIESNVILASSVVSKSTLSKWQEFFLLAEGKNLSEGKKHAFPVATNNKRRIDFHAAFLCAWREVREEGDRVVRVCRFRFKVAAAGTKIRVRANVSTGRSERWTRRKPGRCWKTSFLPLFPTTMAQRHLGHMPATPFSLRGASSQRSAAIIPTFPILRRRTLDNRLFLPFATSS